MITVPVSSEHQYSVLIGCDWKTEILLNSAEYSRALVIYSEAQPRPELDLGNTEVFFHALPDGETGKSLASLDAVFSTLGAAGFTRNDLIVGVGGGAVTDLSGFAAASWLRGIDWIAVPSTLAGMVDAAVGGKTGINTSYGKNLVGAFHSPVIVLEDLSWLITLSDRDFAAGLAEVLKCGFIKDGEILEIISSNDFLELRTRPDLLITLISKAVAVKAAVVSGDFKESFEREILNYGHTFGHAVEKYSRFELRHGECVAIGMSFIAHLSYERGLISEQELAMHLDLLKRLQLPFKLPSSYSLHDWDSLYALMAIDKKSRGSVIRFVSLNGIGNTTRMEIAQSEELRAVYEKVLP